MTSPAQAFLERAAADAFSFLPGRDLARADRPGADGPAPGRVGSCIAVAVRDDVRPTDQPFVDELIQGIGPVLTDAGHRVVRLYGHTDDLFWTLADYIRKWRLGAMVLVSVHAGDPLPGLLHAAGFPFTTVGSNDLGAPFADADNQGGARQAVRWLAQRGHRRIATITGPHSQQAMLDRLDGYRAGLADAGLTADPQLVIEGQGTFESGRERMHELLNRGELDAVFVASDIMTAGAFQALDDAALRVPDDLGVASFDDGDVARDLGVAAVAQPIHELGRAAAELVLEVMAGESPENRLVPTTLVERPSA